MQCSGRNEQHDAILAPLSDASEPRDLNAVPALSDVGRQPRSQCLHRYDSSGLFTGDTIYLDDGEWVAAALGSRVTSPRTSRASSCFDVVVPWAATAGQPFYAARSNADARRRIGAILERLRGGENR